MKIVFFGFGMLELGGGFENYLIDTALDLAKQHPLDDIEIVTASNLLTERYYKYINAIALKREHPSSLYREKSTALKSRLNGIHYDRFNNLKELKLKLVGANVIYTKNEIIELAILRRINARKIAPIVVGVHTPVKYPLTPTLGAKLHNVAYTSFFYGFLLHNVAAIKVNNQDDYVYLKSKFKINNVGVLHHGFEIPKVTAKYSKNKILNVMFAGRLTEQKGLDILVEVVRLVSLKHKVPEVFFKIAGTGNKLETQMVLNLVGQYPNVEYLGHVPQHDMKHIYEWADVSIIPSKFETLNKVAVETAIYEKVAIASDISGPREVIVNGETGYLLPVNAQIFSEKIEDLWNMKNDELDNFKKIGRSARAKIKNEFDNDRVTKTLFETFKFLGENHV